MENKLWHSLPLKQVFDELKSAPTGLTSEEAKKRLKKFGPNKLPEEPKLSKIIILFNQLKSPLVYVLLGAAIISLFLQDFIDAAVILLAVFINTALGFYQENKADKSINFLKKLVDYKAKVRRDNNQITVSTTELVPGDIIFLDAGDKIPADARLITIDNFQIVEAALTGESMPSDKNLKTLDKGMALADRENMVYSSTVVASGRAMAVICETGINTELGKITQLVKEAREEKTPLQLQLTKFSQSLTYLVLSFCLALARRQEKVC